MNRLICFLTTHPFGIGIVVGLLLNLTLQPYVLAGTHSTANMSANTAVYGHKPAMATANEEPTAQIWLDGWALEYNEGSHAMVLESEGDSLWVFYLTDRSPESILGTGTYQETVRVEPPSLQADQTDLEGSMFLSLKAYYSAGILANDSEWTAPVSMFVIEAVALDPDTNTQIQAWGVSLRSTAGTLSEVEAELMTFTEHAFGYGAAPATGRELSTASVDTCISDCQDLLDLELEDARLDRDSAIANCQDNFIACSVLGCVGGSALCGIWYGACLGICLSTCAFFAQRCINRANDDYNRDVDNAYTRYDYCVADCRGESIE